MITLPSDAPPVIPMIAPPPGTVMQPPQQGISGTGIKCFHLHRDFLIHHDPKVRWHLTSKLF